MKTALIIFSSLIALGVPSFFIIRSQTPPDFRITRVDGDKSGTFEFSGIKNSFELSGGKSVSGRNGYVCTVSSPDGKSVVFKLYKNGTFIKDLKTI